jgi:hypothetical protein
LLAAALDETVYVTTNGRRRKIPKREAIIAQMADKLASADLRATKMPIDMMKEVERKAGNAAAAPEPRPRPGADREVVQLFVARLRSQILGEIEEGDCRIAPVASPGRCGPRLSRPLPTLPPKRPPVGRPCGGLPRLQGSQGWDNLAPNRASPRLQRAAEMGGIRSLANPYSDGEVALIPAICATLIEPREATDTVEKLDFRAFHGLIGYFPATSMSLSC